MIIVKKRMKYKKMVINLILKFDLNMNKQKGSL